MPKASQNAQTSSPASGPPPEKLRSGARYPPGYVAAHQRRRLLAAAGPALLEHGYARLTARKVAAAAGVSSASFYAQFENLDDCLLVAQRAAADALFAAIDDLSGAGRHVSKLPPGPDPAWPCRVARAVQVALRLAAEHPGAAALLVCHFPATESGLGGTHFTTVERLATLLHEGRDPGLADPPPDLARGIIGASLSLVATRLLRGEAIDVETLTPTVTQTLLTPYLGLHRATQACA